MRRTSSTLIAITIVLLALGLVILASVSSVRGDASYGDPYYFIKRQLVWLLLSLAIGTCVTMFDYHRWQDMALPLAIIGLLALVVVAIPGIGSKIGGSRRWLRLGPVSVQPSECVKFIMVVSMSAWLSMAGRKVSNFVEGMVIPSAGLLVMLLLLMLEPDFGSTILIGAVAMVLMFVAGTRLSYLVTAGTLGFCTLAIAIMMNSNRWERVLALLDPGAHPEVSYHLTQSKIAFMLGGLYGKGLGGGIQKYLYLPEAHTDFIFAIIGEELGFVGTCSVAMLFLGLLACGIAISYNAPDLFGRLLGLGLTLMVVVQAAINIGVVTGCLPTKGITLPFISYGGSSLVMSVVCVGVLLNIARHCLSGEDDRHRIVKDIAHDNL